MLHRLNKFQYLTLILMENYLTKINFCEFLTNLRNLFYSSIHESRSLQNFCRDNFQRGLSWQEKIERRKEVQKFDYLQNEKSFLDKIKKIFIIFISSGKDVLK